MLNFGCSEVELCEVFGDQLRNLHTWAVEEVEGSLVVRSVKVWRSFGISCFSYVTIFVLMVNVKGF